MACELEMTIWWSWDACELRDGHMLAMGEPWVVCELWDGHMVVMGESRVACELGDDHMVVVRRVRGLHRLCDGRDRVKGAWWHAGERNEICSVECMAWELVVMKVFWDQAGLA